MIVPNGRPKGARFALVRAVETMRSDSRYHG
jgi:hypothetical protein